MKNVTGRKMFRSNAARDKLRQAGGIMSSSQELMEAVQKFSNGGGVRSSYVPGLGYQTPTLPSQIARANQAQINLRRAQRAAGVFLTFHLLLDSQHILRLQAYLMLKL